MENGAKLTPLMQQYWEIKNQHQDKILLFRMGDFYEMFYDDAIKAAPLLNIALTSRNKNHGNDTPMCGVPHHSIGPQINKLLQAGLKVAICDQMEKPEEAEGKIVRRAVTRIVTPGLVYDPNEIEAMSHNYVCALLPKKGERNLFDMAVIDASTGELQKTNSLSLAQVILQIEKLFIKEILLPEGYELPLSTSILLSQKKHEGQSVDKFLVDYVCETQGADILLTLSEPKSLNMSGLKISGVTLKALEFFKTYDGQEKGSFFNSVNCTLTPMGARLLKSRLAQPFTDLDRIQSEHQKIEEMINGDMKSIRDLLSEVGDLERKTVKLSHSLCNSRDLMALAHSLQKVYELSQILPQEFNKVEEKSWAKEVSEKIIRVIKSDSLPVSTKEGGMINLGIHPTLDEYIDLTLHAQEKLTALELKEKTSTGITSLKVKFNNVFGYSFEVTKSNLDKVPSYFVRKQTLAQAERFITPELTELETKILSSQQKRDELEFEIYNNLRKEILSQALGLLKLSKIIAQIDVVYGFARLALEKNYVRPIISEELKGITLEKSRHPVVEQKVGEPFIPNNIQLHQGSC
jgi:DNA mismatch repair protein MutS